MLCYRITLLTKLAIHVNNGLGILLDHVCEVCNVEQASFSQLVATLKVFSIEFCSANTLTRTWLIE